MRITHSQIAALEKIIIEANLTLELFEKERQDDSVLFKFKDNYFSYRITKAAEQDIRVVFKPVYSTKEIGTSGNWETMTTHFTRWCVEISNDIESEKRVFNPDSKPKPEIGIYQMSATIKKISPKFDLIFNQAFQAEEYGLNEICGLGYRKAFEFLIKDYVMRGMSKDDALAIKQMGITDVVRKHIQDAGINLILHRILWLGNDHAHYLPVWKTKTINDLKGLIYTTMTWIEANEQLAKIDRHALKVEKQMPYKSKK